MKLRIVVCSQVMGYAMWATIDMLKFKRGTEVVICVPLPWQKDDVVKDLPERFQSKIDEKGKMTPSNAPALPRHLPIILNACI